jgi:hypothetical protein
MSFLPRIKYGINSSRNPEFSCTDTFIQIVPTRVISLYQFQLPCPFLFLYLFFPLESRFPRFMDFIPNEAVNAVFLGKTIHQIVFMLISTLGKV